MKERSPLTVLYYKMHACLLTVLETGLTAVSRYLYEMFVHKSPCSPSERASQTVKQGNSTNFCPLQAPCSLLQPTTGHSIRAGCHCISLIGIFINERKGNSCLFHIHGNCGNHTMICGYALLPMYHICIKVLKLL